jgi:hypothetical protein
MSEIDSIKHKTAKRAHIPSREEAGFEDASPTVQGKQTNDYQLNPVVHRGQDPELFWLNKYGNDDREELLRVSDMAKQTTKAKAEKTLRIELDDDAFDRLYGHTSHPIEVKGKGHKVAVRVISQFGEESTKVIML